jgi:hypothetical protein
MSGFENYPRELAGLDQEIHHYATICGIDLANRGEVEACMRRHHEDRAGDKARETLQGLLILRIKVETEMIELGMMPPPLVPTPPQA